jgi:RNA polymerase sigma-70 factor (ECF subfamily)
VRLSRQAELAAETGHGTAVMELRDRHELTRLLQDWSAGDRAALEKLVPRVQKELQRIARYYMAGERRNHPLQTTALINEAYIRLMTWKNVDWQNRAHFFAVSAQLMRRILVDIARARQQRKRSGGAIQVTLDETVVQTDKTRELIAIDEALTRLAEIDVRKSQIVELRFFGGLTEEEVAAVMRITDRTVRREWKLARAWLHDEVTRLAGT